jgi:colicin import membrane protein
LFVAIILVAAMRWRSEPPATPLAIEGNVVRYEDLPRSVRSGRPLAEPAPEAAALREPPPVKPEPVSKPDQAPDAAAAAAQKKQQADAQQAQAREAQQRAAEEARRADELNAQKRAEAESRRKAEATAKAQTEAEAKAKAELAARQKQENEAAARAAKLKSEREAELRRALAAEEEGEAVAQSGVMDEYRAMLVQAIERNWNRPPSAKAGLECTLFVTQATGGTVLDVKLGDCNGDQAVRESVVNAVYRSSPLPAPRDPRAFERRLVIVFKPTE